MKRFLTDQLIFEITTFSLYDSDNGIRQPGNGVPVIIAISTALAVAVSLISLSSGCYIIFQNLFYIPIIIACFYYWYRGLVFSFIVSFLYIDLMFTFTQDATILTGALFRTALFILIGVLAVQLSMKYSDLTAIKESETRYKDLFNNMSSGVVVYEPVGDGEDFIIKDINHSSERIDNLSREDAVERSVLDVFPGLDEMKLIDTFREVWRTGEPRRHPISHYTDERSRGWRENYVYKLPSGEIVAIYDDVTSRVQAEEALEASDKRFRDLFNNMSSGVAVYKAVEDGEDFIFTGFNDAAERIDNISREEVIGRSILEIFPGVKDFGLFDTIQNVWRTGVSEDHPVSIYEDNRITGWRENYVYKLQAGEVVCIYDDVTDKMQAEEALKESEAKYHDILQNMLDGYFRTDIEGRILMANPAAARLFGYESPEEISEILSPTLYSDKNQRQKILNILKEHGKVEDFITEGKRKDGNKLWISISVQEVYDFKGNQTGFESFLRDITERKEAEDQLVESEEKFRELVENISDVILSLSPEGIITYISPVCKKVYGLEPEEVIGKSFSGFIYPEDLEMVMEGFHKRLEGDYSENLFRIQTPDGRTHHVRTTMTPSIKNGDIVGFNYVLNDYSDRKRAEEALQQINKKLKMLSSITRHDILNTITAIKGYIELESLISDDPEMKKYIDMEDRAVNTIQRQIEFTRYYEDLGVHEPEWQDIGIAASEAANELIEKGIEFENSLHGVEVFADPLVGRVFFNLIENSIRHGEHVTKILFSYEEKDGNLVITYRDNGVGINEEEKNNLFRRGFGRNTGLGLFLSREILSITEITIQENGEEGNGVVFEILVPEKNYRFNGENSN